MGRETVPGPAFSLIVHSADSGGAGSRPLSHSFHRFFCSARQDLIFAAFFGADPFLFRINRPLVLRITVDEHGIALSINSYFDLNSQKI